MKESCFLGGQAGKGMEPVGEVGGALLYGPGLHRTCHHVGNVKASSFSPACTARSSLKMDFGSHSFMTALEKLLQPYTSVTGAMTLLESAECFMVAPLGQYQSDILKCNKHANLMHCFDLY
jgi:hypothetical protein